MARMYPDTRTTRVIFASRAEEDFYNVCQEGLGDNWKVYYSCTLSTIDGQAGLKDNEIDFVVYHPRFGVLVIEVKGGRIQHSADTGKYYSINRHNERFRIKDPFQQALVWKGRFLRELRKRHIKVPVSHAVSLPSVREDELTSSASLVTEIVIGRQRMLNIETTLKNIIKQCQEEKYLTFSDVADELHALLWGKDFTTRLFLKDYLRSNDLRVNDVEVIQETLVRPIASSNRLAIEGEAGTGKTLLALLLAKQFRNEGKRVLLLTSNRLLNVYLKKELGEGVDVKTFVEFAESFGVHLLNPDKSYAGTREDWTQYEAPERLLNLIKASETRYDALLCDEAQDVQPFWWEAIESVLASEDSHFQIFFDRSQGVFGLGMSDRGFVPEEALPIKPPYFPLIHNYRTTREITTFARSFRTGTSVMKSHSGRLGYVPELLVYEDREDCRRQLAQLFRKLFRDEELATHDVTLLSARNPAKPESVVRHDDVIAKYPLQLLSADNKKLHDKKGSKVPISTISSFKGLETSVAIMLNISEHRLPIDNPMMASLIYVACTRAKHMLYIMVEKGDPKHEAFKNALSLIKTTGAMVLEGSDANYEFVGTVSYYNLNRVGWLSVSDPSFQKSSIMFFPHDVIASGLTDITVGTRLRFRPRVEGETTIATDLKQVKAEMDKAEHDNTKPTTNDNGVEVNNAPVAKKAPKTTKKQAARKKTVKHASSKTKKVRKKSKSPKP